jgi:hypothetical protein
VDRLEIYLDVWCISRGMINTYDGLYFLFDKAIDGQRKETPKLIPKTLIFVNTITEVMELTEWFHKTLLMFTTRYCLRHREYNSHWKSSSPHSVYNVILEYHSRVSQADKDLWLNEFRKEPSISRIIVMTSILGEGFHTRGIERVALLFKHHKDISIEDMTQAGGYGACGPKESCVFHMLLPYWCFDSKTRLKSSAQASQSDPGNTGWNSIERRQRDVIPKG